MSDKYLRCRLCIDYFPYYSYREKGFCNRVDESAHAFFAYTCPEFKCRFEDGPRKTITEQEAEERWENIKNNRKKFLEMVERASKNIDKTI